MSNKSLCVFASYLPEDEGTTRPILDLLEEKGCRIISHPDTKAFNDLPAFISVQISECDIFLVLLSDKYPQHASYSQEPLIARRMGKHVLAVLLEPSADAAALAHVSEASLIHNHSVLSDISKALDKILSDLELEVEDLAAQLARKYLHLGLKMYRRCRYEDAVMLFENAAENGNKEALFHLGTCILNGHGTRMDEKKGYRYIYDAAESGVPDAQYFTAFHLLEGDYYDKNEELAVSFLQKAADSNHADSLTLLGKLYYHGIGVAADKAYAITLFEKAAAQDEPEAINLLKKLKKSEE